MKCVCVCVLDQDEVGKKKKGTIVGPSSAGMTVPIYKFRKSTIEHVFMICATWRACLRYKRAGLGACVGAGHTPVWPGRLLAPSPALLKKIYSSESPDDKLLAAEQIAFSDDVTLQGVNSNSGFWQREEEEEEEGSCMEQGGGDEEYIY